MTDVLSRYNSGKLWDFDGGTHPPEMKSQSNQTPITFAPLAQDFFVPVKQHAGNAGNILVKVGDNVLKGQPLTQGNDLRTLPVHAPTSGVVKAIAPFVAAHPSGLSELAIHIQADGLDQWRPQNPVDDFLQLTPEQLIDKIYQAGIAGLGGAVFPTATKVNSAQNKVKLLIINGAECEPYITCDDRLMRDYAQEIIEGCRILRYILRPEKIVIAIEDNKPEAVKALEQALYGADDIDIRVIPTKYPSGAAKQLIQILTGMEVPHGQRSSSIGVLMQNVGTVFAIKRAVINDEPLIERVVTLTGDKIPHKGNQWVRFGTPIQFVLENAGYQADKRFPVFVGGPMMGLMVPNLQAPITKTANCLLAPDHFEYDPLATEQSCIRCSACSDACPVHLMPQQMYWYSRAEDHDNAQKQNIMDCIECGLCAYVCPSHIPLIQYFRQEKAQIWDIAEKAKKAEEAKMRFEARQARLEQEAQERQARTQRAAAARREEIAASQGEDPVKAALARLKAKKAGETADIHADAKIKTIISEQGETLPDNSALMAQRKARRLARQQQAENNPLTNGACGSLAISETEKTSENPTALDPKKAAIAAALARAKAKKAAQQAAMTNSTQTSATTSAQTSALSHSAVENGEISATESTEQDPKKAAIAAAIARAKAKKAAQQAAMTNSTQTSAPTSAPTSALSQSAVKNEEISETAPVEQDPKKAAVAAAIARAKAKKAAQQAAMTNSTQTSASTSAPTSTLSQSAVKNEEISATELAEQDPKKAAVAAAIARAKAKKAAQQAAMTNSTQTSTITSAPTSALSQSAVENEEISETAPVEQDPKKAAIAVAIARAKTKKAAQQAAMTNSTQSSATTSALSQSAVENEEISATEPAEQDPKKAAIAAAIARAKAKKAALQREKETQ